MRIRFVAFATLSVAIAVLAVGAEAVTQYTITDLGALADGASTAYGLNDLGQVVGTSQTPGGLRSFIWDGGVMTDLGTLDGDTTWAYSVNNLGQVVGKSIVAGSGVHAFLWEAGAMTDLDPRAGHHSSAECINDDGMVVGRCDYVAVLWQDGAMAGLGTLGGDDSVAMGVNSLGVVVGGSSLPTGDPTIAHAFVWEDGVMTRLLAADEGSLANAVNRHGVAAGYEVTPGGGTRPCIWEDGVITYLATLDADTSRAYDINDRGQVVGNALGEGWVRAWLWEDGVVYDLNDLVTGDSGWFLSSARAINEHGQIVGTGTDPSGDSRAFLLSPVPEAGAQTLAWLCVLSLLAGKIARRRITAPRSVPAARREPR